MTQAWVKQPVPLILKEKGTKIFRNLAQIFIAEEIFVGFLKIFVLKTESRGQVIPRRRWRRG